MKKFCLVIAVILVFVCSCDNLYNDIAEEKKDMQKLIFVNADGVSVDLTKDPYGITEWEGFSKVDLNLQTQQVPFHDGSVYLDGLLSERELSVTLAMNDEKNLEKRYRLRRELIEILNPKLGEGTLIYTNNYTSKQIKVIPQTPLFETHNSNDSGTPKASLAWTACDPYWEDVDETVVEFDMTNPAVINNEGDVPTEVKIELSTGYCKDVVVRNITDDKLIKINGVIDKPVIINTEQGKKSVLTNDIKFQWSNGGTWQQYAETNDRLFVYGSQLLRFKQNSEVETFDVQMSVVCYSDDLKMFVGWISGHFTYSYDGLNWQNGSYVDLYYPLDLINVIIWCEEKNLFVAGGRSTYATRYVGEVFTSTDGINWTGTYYGNMGAIKDIAYSPTLGFYAVGNYVSEYAQKVSLIKSADGITWSEVTGQYSRINCVWSNALGVMFISRDSRIEYSYDGENWSIQNVVGSSPKLVSIDSLGLVIIVGLNNNGNIVLTTFDGLTFSETTSLNVGSLAINKILFSNVLNQIVIIGSKGLILMGDNVNNLHELSTLLPIPFLSSIYANGYFYAVGTDFLRTKTVKRLIDGNTWEDCSEDIPSVIRLYDIYYSIRLGLFIAVGEYDATTQDRSVVLTSEDGLDWSYVYRDTTAYDGYRIAENPEKLLIATSSNVLGSNDGITWEAVVTKKLGCICWNDNNNYFYATEITSGIIYENGSIIKSIDGITWEDTGYTANYIGYVPQLKKLIAKFSDGVYISSDGNTWRKTDMQIGTAKISDITYMNDSKLVLAVTSRTGSNLSDPSYIYISSDLIHWSKIQETRQNLISCAYNPDTKKAIITSGRYGYQPQGDESVFMSVQEASVNIINRLDSDSNMNFKIIKGENIIKMNYTEGSCIGRITYRQKYLGV